ncbi:hypothetical protein FNV43_RR24299 [Rhamnella rubrinervis]|uniref:Cyclic nucleotide-binding domain-containing protein n=1 Tax=Rhamnella rubrinervis TaxID=2594499 RepID=A0A8K0GL30_9ROSA|nr:hypothetical protein FNV43_RR24299 [Rhamnella rubrinervis]
MNGRPRCHVAACWFYRWKEFFFQRKGLESNSKSVSGRSDDNDSSVVVSNDSQYCRKCTQVGIPVFYSNRCHHWDASAGSSFRPITLDQAIIPTRTRRSLGVFGGVIDPRSKAVKRWNRIVLLARGMALAVDPLFFYVLSLSGSGAPCFYMDVALAMIVTVVRSCLDVLHLGYLFLQFKVAYVSSESMVVGCGNLVWDARAIASHNVRSLRGFWLDAFVILPIPQAVIWIVIRKLLREEQITWIMTTLLVSFLFQFLPKVYHIIYLIKRLQKVTGYVFGSSWWRFNLNVIAYLIASHVAGACWYVIATERLVTCLQQQCDINRKCNSLSLYCLQAQLGNSTLLRDVNYNLTTIKSKCLDVDGPFNYGIYTPALLVFSSNSLAVKILYPIFWGLLNLSTFGNELEPTCNWLELIFSCCITLAGLALFITLIGNIQVCLQTVMANKKKMQLKYRDMEWWMRRRQLPNHLRERVRHFQRHSWAAMEGQDEMELIQHLPDGLRRDIKRFLCLDLVKKVPLFHVLDDLILDNICDRVRPLIYSQGEKIIREGDPVQRMMFIVRGCLSRRQGLSNGFQAISEVKPGGFMGDELLSWCLRLPAVDRLPSSSATFTCIESVEAFAIDAHQLRYIINHFRYKFASDRLKRTARYCSSNWRTWGAVVIQLAWRRHRVVTRRCPYGMRNGDEENQLRLCVSFFLSLRPHDHLE